MKKILGIFIVAITLYGSTYNMETFRKQERTLVLKEFKQLHEKRKHLYRYSSQTLQIGRSKVLQKRKLLLFQPKSNFDSNVLFQTEKEHSLEATNVFYTDISEEKFTLESDGALDMAEESAIYPENDLPSTPVETTGIIESSTKVRPTVNSPWARR